MGVLTDWLIVDPDLEGRAAAKAHGGPVEFHPVDGTVLALYPHHPRFYITCGWCGVWLSECWCPPGGPDGPADGGADR